MTSVLIFGGTTEGRLLFHKCIELEIPVIISVATDYGERILLEDEYGEPCLGEHVRILTGRMDAQEISVLIAKEEPEWIIDATHPYAIEISENVRFACEENNKSVLRIKRELGTDLLPAENEGTIRYFSTMEDMICFLKKTTGNILATTGSKEIQRYKQIDNYEKRLYVRILPAVENIKKCREEGIEGSHILAMQGPFSEELNAALLREYQIEWMTTKISGKAGGFEEKKRGAKRVGTKLLCVLPPSTQEGMSLEAVYQILEGSRNGKVH